MRDDDRARRVLAERRVRRSAPDVVAELTAEWFPEERAFFDDPAPLTAAQCGRRAGKTRGVVRDHLRDLLTIPGYRGLYLNTTRGEAERLAWVGNRADGFRPLIERLKLPLKLDNADLTIHNPATDGWMLLRGADDEAELRKRLGGAYHKVTWDEWQKIPPKLGLTLREVFFPALLDFEGKFRGTGTPARQMSGLAWDVTRPELEKRAAGWSVHHWTLLENPYWGQAKRIRGEWYVVWGARDQIVSGPHASGELQAAVAGSRMTKGILALQALYGGPEVAPIDSPIMQREGFGKWVREDAAFVYHVHKVLASRLFYAPDRKRADGFPDIPRALADMPWNWREAFFSLGADIGYNPDPFALVLHAWHPHDPCLYEVASWRKHNMTSQQQAAAITAVREHVAIGLLVADAGGPARPAVAGWSAEFVERFGVPILEAEKAHKHLAIDMWNGDISTGRYKMREGGVLYEEMSQLQWATIVSATGRMIEDPTLDNHACFVAGTLIQTGRGEVPIEEVTVGDKVWTRKGLRYVLIAGATGERPTFRVAGLEGTRDHPVWTARGWKQLLDLTPDDTLWQWVNTDRASRSRFRAYLTDAIPRALVVTSGSTSIHRTVERFIARSGKRFADRFQMALTSITRTATRLTTGYEILPWWTAHHICASTPVNPSESRSLSEIFGSQSPPPPSGTVLRRAGLGTASTPNEPLNDESNTNSFVRCAEPGFVRWSGRHGFAVRDVTPVDGACATRRFETVYNLTIDGASEYFANGILVHNCDAGLYSHRHSWQYRARPADKKLIPGSVEAKLAEERALEDYAEEDGEDGSTYH